LLGLGGAAAPATVAAPALGSVGGLPASAMPAAMSSFRPAASPMVGRDAAGQGLFGGAAPAGSPAPANPASAAFGFSGLGSSGSGAFAFGGAPAAAPAPQPFGFGVGGFGSGGAAAFAQARPLSS